MNTPAAMSDPNFPSSILARLVFCQALSSSARRSPPGLWRIFTKALLSSFTFTSLGRARLILVCLGFTTPLTANRAIWFGLRWSLGGGVASTRSQGDFARRTDFRRTAQATP